MFSMKVRLAGTIVDRRASVLYRSPVLTKYHPQGAPQ